ncbi:MAG: right-handed parallel beta-helix repeat-containing protein [Bacteroides sp.]|nr:right-handed parallel beta-helix repeat-containing protein [Bacteroides sp.]
MKTKSLFAAALCLVGWSSASAASWFVKADAPDGNDGSTWETALNLADCITKMSDMNAGDNVYFAGGTYTYPELQASGKALVTGLKMQNKPVNLHGGYPADLTGTDVPTLVYPTATPTILDGDRNGNGIADEGDVRNLIFIQTTKDQTALLQNPQQVLIEGFVLQGAYYNGTKGTELGALNVDMTHTVTVRNCIFRGNKCEKAGAAFSNSGSQTHFIDCIFEDNEGESAGIAINQSKRGDADKYFKPVATVERCLITGNRAVVEGKVAGGSAIRLNAGSVYIINSTITANSGYKQAAIHMNDATQLYIASSTIADNTVTLTETGSAIYSTGTPAIRIINSYILGMENEETIPAISLCEMTTKVSDVLVSDGGNIFGMCDFTAAEEGGSAFDNNFEADVIIPGYDDYNVANTPFALFGRTGLEDKGGFSKVLVPKTLTGYYRKADFAGLFKSEYKCPVDVDDMVDQRNVERPANISVGAYDAGQDSSIDTVESRQAFTVTSLGNGVYALAEPADDICVYDLASRLVIRTSGSTVDLSAKASGLYILCADGHSAKIIR